MGRIRFEHTDVFLLTNFDLNTKCDYVGDSNTTMLAIRTQHMAKLEIQIKMAGYVGDTFYIIHV